MDDNFLIIVGTETRSIVHEKESAHTDYRCNKGGEK